VSEFRRCESKAGGAMTMLFNNMVVLSRAFWVPDGPGRDRYPRVPKS